MKFKKIMTLVLASTSATIPLLSASCVQTSEQLKNMDVVANKLKDLESQNKKLNTEVTKLKKMVSVNELRDYYVPNTNIKYKSSPETQNLLKDIFQVTNSEEYNKLDKNQKILKISEMMLGHQYVGDYLVGSPTVAEELIVDLYRLDCFTYLDYVNALITAKNIDTFIDNLKATRYKNSQVEYSKRKHYFTDWELSEPAIVKNLVVDSLGSDNIVKHEIKNLNVIKGKVNIQGASEGSRTISYLKHDKLTDEFLANNFKSGDLIMLAAPETLNDWLDVTHCGYLVFKDEDGKKVAYYRNASSSKKYNRVVDIPLVDYIKDRNYDTKNQKPYDAPKVPGILLYRTI
ncbi:N-acetylmuramoyl-L-alanine amidase-like domain-containing protein [Mycoplasmopsis ciconiae]|uniref:N-acetylmuramoyl-L-alanine amidase-like domain-containing protein n=1 Tax=Mycoplasmopsis ciconiae TaxID=561067 RepID=A0ABU7MLB0_9BACT|nr:N-acetylmuramoyl-L-alanine amidase-like domain-containing protein [Mycoplasmopsis ciconiae]